MYLTKMALRTCLTCGTPFRGRPEAKYCKHACYAAAPTSPEARARMSEARKGKPKSDETRARMSAATTGQPKPWQKGERNSNYGNRAQNKNREKFLAAVRLRGLGWSEEDRQRHSETMKGPSNKMRGTRHTPEARARMSAAKQEQYRQGTVRIKRYKISQAERLIAAHLTGMGVEFRPQFHIKGEPYLYDFYFPAAKTIVEYQGDYWHANPKKYPSGTTLPIQNAGPVLVDTIWERDRLKREAAERHGFKVVYIWEQEFKKQGIGCLDVLGIIS